MEGTTRILTTKEGEESEGREGREDERGEEKWWTPRGKGKAGERA